MTNKEKINDTYWLLRDLKLSIKDTESNSHKSLSNEARLLSLTESIGEMLNEFSNVYNQFLENSNHNGQVFNTKLDQLLEQTEQKYNKDNQLTKGKILGKLETLEQTDTVKDIIKLVEEIE